MASETEPDIITSRPEPHRRSSLGYLNYMPGARSLRHALTREKFIEAMKTMVWVVPLTLLIWVYAEREQLIYPNSPNANNVIVRFTPSPLRHIEPTHNPQPTVNLKLTGTQDAIEIVKQKLTGAEGGVSIDVGQRPAGDDQPINVVEGIQNMQLFKTNGVTVIESQPPEILINVDVITTTEVPVELSPADAPTLSESRFEPGSVMVQGPAKLLKPKPHVYADLSQVSLNTTSEHPAQVVPLKLAKFDPLLQILRPTVNATLVVKAHEISWVDESIPLDLRGSVATLEKYAITVNGENQGSVGNITLTGPPEQIDAIKDLKFNPKAVLEISPEDAIRLEPKLLHYDGLPPGVKVDPESAGRKIDFKMVER